MLIPTIKVLVGVKSSQCDKLCAPLGAIISAKADTLSCPLVEENRNRSVTGLPLGTSIWKFQVIKLAHVGY